MYKRWPRYFVVCITLQASKELFSSCFQGKKLHQVHILLEVKKGPKGKKYLQIPCQMFSVFWGYKRLAAFCTMYISTHNCVLCHQVPTYLVLQTTYIAAGFNDMHDYKHFQQQQKKCRACRHQHIFRFKQYFSSFFQH